MLMYVHFDFGCCSLIHIWFCTFPNKNIDILQMKEIFFLRFISRTFEKNGCESQDRMCVFDCVERRMVKI